MFHPMLHPTSLGISSPHSIDGEVRNISLEVALKLDLAPFWKIALEGARRKLMPTDSKGWLL